MESIPFYIPFGFVLTALVTIFLFYRAANNSKLVVLILSIWLIVQSAIAYAGFYVESFNFPPRFLVLVSPPLIVIISLFLTKKGRAFIDQFDQRKLTYLHTVRIPVELILYGLFVYGLIPDLMTFEGRNFDILAGLTAPFIGYFGYTKMRIGNRWKLLWNMVSLALLLNIVIHAILSAPTPFQQIAFDQPNIAIVYFPYNLLPGLIVPLVLLSHLACIRSIRLNS